MMADAVSVLIVDDHALFRRGVRSLLSTMDGVEVIGEAADGETAVTLSAELAPDLVLMDLQMPGVGGLAAIRTIAEQSPTTNILVLTMFEDDDSVFAAMRAGARGYVLKDMDADDFARAIITVGRGEALFSRGIATRVIRFFSEPPSAAVAFPNLTDSERSVLRLMATGASNATISRQLSLSPKTVRNYISNVFRKLQVADRAQAIVIAREAGLNPPRSDAGRRLFGGAEGI
ncbi:MAG: response regulator transcription factor [Actinobacteria bacterium]|nr:response regulator transcription factor [Actinomycetota bacterium]